MTPASALVLPDRNATFHPFPRLPLEIRRMIWRTALPGPRNVALKHFCLKNPEYPTVRESLDVASETYTLTFGSLGAESRT
ncbi:hypothetical protein BCON_0092g00060 [Botryotinia convoluta]|uniref:2EXR domain-containing protein n=1 Tax=Botryotinia convoluta TaxID=54673 RepID=A0A4Z1IF67_9HELO|nr:hypothetical protein BCON_0092g00060 [Botryotinia convoluta]